MVATDIPTSERDRGPTAAAESELEALQRIAQLLERRDADAVKLVTATGEKLDLPASLQRVLLQAIHILAQDRAVILEHVGKQLTLQEAADLLNVSRPYVVKLINAGELPHVMVGTQRRVPLDALLAYDRQVAKLRRESLRKLTQLSQEWGLNDLDYSKIQVKRLAEMGENSEP